MSLNILSFSWEKVGEFKYGELFLDFIFGGGHTEYGSHDPSQHAVTMVRLTGASFTGECFTIVRLTGVQITGGALGAFGGLAGVGGGAAAGSRGPNTRFLNS